MIYVRLLLHGTFDEITTILYSLWFWCKGPFFLQNIWVAFLASSTVSALQNQEIIEPCLSHSEFHNLWTELQWNSKGMIVQEEINIENEPSVNAKPRVLWLCPANSCTDFASFLHCWDKKEYSVYRGDKKGHDWFWGQEALWLRSKGCFLLTLPFVHTLFFMGLQADLAPLKATGRGSRPVNNSLPSSGKHQHNTVAADTEDKCWEWRICFSSLQGWWLLVKPVYLGVKCGNTSLCRRRVGRVYFLSAWNGCSPCRCGQAPAALGACRAGHPLRGPSQEPP